MSPKASNTNIAQALLAELKSGQPVTKVVKSLAAYLVADNRHGDMQAVVRELERLLLVDEGKLYVHATVAYQLSPSQLTTIKKMFSKHDHAKTVVVQQTIDPDVIGGVRLQTAEHQLDLTIRRQLQKLKNAPLTHTV